MPIHDRLLAKASGKIIAALCGGRLALSLPAAARETKQPRHRGAPSATYPDQQHDVSNVIDVADPPYPRVTRAASSASVAGSELSHATLRSTRGARRSGTRRDTSDRLAQLRDLGGSDRCRDHDRPAIGGHQHQAVEHGF